MADLPGRALAQELMEKSREESRTTPMEAVIAAARAGQVSDEASFRLIGHLWTLERMFYYIYIELQRMRARQIWDECKHSKLHADVLLGKGWVKQERELMGIAQANAQPLPAYFGLSMMFPHIHPLARAAQNYYQEAIACLGIMAYLRRVDDPLVRHEHLSQRDEELMHFMEGKFQIDMYCATPDTQKPVEEALDYLQHQVGGIR
jgi:hypothetical protein